MPTKHRQELFLVEEFCTKLLGRVDSVLHTPLKVVRCHPALTSRTAGRLVADSDDDLNLEDDANSSFWCQVHTDRRLLPIIALGKGDLTKLTLTRQPAQDTLRFLINWTLSCTP